MPIRGSSVQSNYRILVSGACRPRAELYFQPSGCYSYISSPLRSEDVEPTIDLHSLLIWRMSERGMALSLTTVEPVPALSEADAAWVDTLLRQKVSANDVVCIEARESSSGKGISLSKHPTLLKFSE